MSHVAQQVADALVSALVSGVAAVSGRVFDSRVTPLDPDELPGIIVIDGGEAIDTSEVAPETNRKQARAQRWNIHLVESAASGVIRELRARRLDAEQALAADPTLGGLAITSRLESVSPPRIDEGVEVPVAITTLVHLVEVWTFEQAPDVAL